MGVLLLNGSDHNGQRAQNLGAPTATTDAATKAYVDGKASGGSGLDSTTFVDVGVVNNGSVSAAAFVTVPMPVVNGGNSSLYSTSTYQYTVPATGTYLALARLRFTDGSIASNMGMGVHTANDDNGPYFQWQGPPGAGSRYTQNYQRIGAFNAGDKLRLYTYIDASGSKNIVAAGLVIVRLF